jgi:hypothetical protein
VLLAIGLGEDILAASKAALVAVWKLSDPFSQSLAERALK